MRSSTTPRLWLLLLSGALGGGCGGLPSRVESRLPPQAARGVVYVAGGAGRRPDAAIALASQVDASRLCLRVESFDWGHETGLGLSDAVDVQHARQQGCRLACEVRRCLAERPGRPVSLVGYSAGCAVILAAADALPPDSLDRIVLLSPAVSPCYDLRRPLASASRGLDVFYSERDWLWLGIGTSLTGTPDGGRGDAAGRWGFCPPTLLPSEAALAARLRQHPWNPSVSWTGNRGGHGGVLLPAFVRTYVLPLLVLPYPR